MATVDLQDIQEAARWIAANEARDSADAAHILGISRARLSQLMSEGEIDRGRCRTFSGRIWIPKSEIDKHIIAPGEVRVGRPRSGTLAKPRNGRKRS